MAHSFQPPSEPSYLLADFPSTSQDRLRAHDNKDPNTSELSLEDPETPAPRGHGGHESFRWKFMPGRIFTDCIATLLPVALLGFAIAVMLLDGKETEKAEHRKWENVITVVSLASVAVPSSLIDKLF
jgi:hypothetical protein